MMMRRGSRLGAIAEFFGELEKRYGSIDSLCSKEVAVERCERLSGEALSRLFTHSSLGLVIPKFLDPTLAEALGRRLQGEKARNWAVTSRGVESSDVATLGTPLNVAEATGEDYYGNVEPTKRRLRDLAGGLGGPLDALRADLDDAWPRGATVAKGREDRPRHAGLARLTRGPTKWREGFVHVDDLAPLTPTTGLFSANVYLNMPRKGGHLELWPLGFRNRWQFYKNARTLSCLTVQDRDAQLLLRRKLPPPHVVHPEPGDLVLLCVQRPHAVAGFDEPSTRVSLQSFITHHGPKRPLVLEN
mmetsp:Transcript_36198/g.115937  ORF Transcript_36198/g.115937 Transcript_36198/m.115937 type:complete len:302 (-) Transcript_36198:1553-2458(-)